VLFNVDSLNLFKEEDCWLIDYSGALQRAQIDTEEL